MTGVMKVTPIPPVLPRYLRRSKPPVLSSALSSVLTIVFGIRRVDPLTSTVVLIT